MAHTGSKTRVRVTRADASALPAFHSIPGSKVKVTIAFTGRCATCRWAEPAPISDPSFRQCVRMYEPGALMVPSDNRMLVSVTFGCVMHEAKP